MDGLLNEQWKAVQAISKNLEHCLLGKKTEIDLLLTSLLAGGHVLLEDVPGTGKTLVVKALARSIDGEFRRVQCNPDLLPSDITGVSIYHPKQENFIYRPGPVMTHILLVDEINRATTKTQSALLEAMEEHHVSVDGDSYALPKPFMLLATQNPIDFEGTYLLPEAQLDRFMFKFSLGYPSLEAEMQMVSTQSTDDPLLSIQPVVSIDQVLRLQQRAKEMFLDSAVQEYIVELTRRVREHSALILGPSPRATISLVRAAKAYAFVQQRDYVLPDDVKYLAPYVLGHRMIFKSEARLDGQSLDSVLRSVFQSVKAPVRIGK